MRKKGVSFSVPIVYGSIATPIIDREKATKSGIEESHSHTWSIYIKSPTEEDISWLFQNVQIILHESFVNNVREFKAQPYQVDESGWGEFEIVIKLFLASKGNEKPLILFHHLKLFNTVVTNPETDRLESVIHERYDEVIIQDPEEELYKAYRIFKDKSSGNKHKTFTSEYEHEELTSIVTAIASVQAELQSYKSRALAAIDALDPAGNRTIDLGVTNSSLNLVIPGYTEPDQDNDNEEEIAKKEVVQ